MANKKTIVILIPGFPKDEEDSTCLPFQQSFASYLKRNYPGLTVIVLSFQYPHTAGEYFFRSIPVQSFGGRNRGGISKLLLRRQANNKLKKILNTNGIDAILSFWFGECALAGTRFGRKHGIKHYCWLMGQDAKPGNHYVKKINLSPGKLLALSNFLQDEFERNYNIKPAHVIAPGIDIKTFPGGNAIKDIDVLAAGSLIPLKQFEVFITVIAEIKKTVPSVNAALIGNGPEKEKLLQLVRQYKLEDNVKLTGELPHHVAMQLMQRSKLFLHTSSYEGFGMVCLEALFAGAKVISFTRPMKNGIDNWFTAATAEEMKNKALELLGQKISSDAEFEYTMEKCASSIMALLG